MEELTLEQKLTIEFVKLNADNITHQQIVLACDLGQAIAKELVMRFEGKVDVVEEVVE